MHATLLIPWYTPYFSGEILEDPFVHLLLAIPPGFQGFMRIGTLLRLGRSTTETKLLKRHVVVECMHPFLFLPLEVAHNVSPIS